MIEGQFADLVSSEVLEDEIARIPDEYRKDRVEGVLRISNKLILIDSEIESVANQFNKQGIKAMDALHLATAVCTKVDYFCSTDDMLLKKARHMKTGKTKIISPIELLIELVR